MRPSVLLLLLSACRGTAPVAIAAVPEDQVVDVLADAAQDDDLAWSRLTHLCDDIGHRITGSEALRRAVDWSVEELGKDGFDRVAAELEGHLAHELKQHTCPICYELMCPPARTPTATACSAPISVSTDAGTSATRRSPGAVSLRTPILIAARETTGPLGRAIVPPLE